MLRQGVQQTRCLLNNLQTQSQRNYFAGNGLAHVKTVMQDHAHHDASQVVYWQYAAYAGAFIVTSFTAYLWFSGAFHEHIDYDNLPKWPHLRIRNKPFPWGDCGLLERSSQCIPYKKPDEHH